MAIKIKWLSDDADATRGSKAVKASLEDVADSMEDLVDAGEKIGKTTDDIARDLSKLDGRPFDEVRRDVERADKALDELGDEANRAGRTLDKVGDEGKAAGKKLKDGLDEAKNEAGQSGREAAASFGGGFEDVVDFAQETLANALSGFGPAGAAAGIALAAGLGAALQGAADAQEKLQAAREAASQLSATLYENNGVLPISDQVSKLFDLLATESGPTNFVESLINQWADFGSVLDDVKRSATLTGTPVSELVRTLGSGDVKNAKSLLEGINEALDDIGNQTGSPLGEIAGQERALLATKSQLEQVIKTAELADSVLGAVGESYVKGSEERAEAAKTHADEVRSRIEEIGGAWRNAATDAGDYVTKTEEGIGNFDWEAYLTDAETTLAAAEDFKRKIVMLPVDVATEATEIFGSQGARAATSYTDAYLNATDSDKERFVNAARANSEAAGTSAAKGFVDSANAGIDGWKPRDFTSTIAVRLDTSEWDNWSPREKQGYIRANKLDTWE